MSEKSSNRAYFGEHPYAIEDVDLAHKMADESKDHESLAALARRVAKDHANRADIAAEGARKDYLTAQDSVRTDTQQ